MYVPMCLNQRLEPIYGEAPAPGTLVVPPTKERMRKLVSDFEEAWDKQLAAAYITAVDALVDECPVTWERFKPFIKANVPRPVLKEIVAGRDVDGFFRQFGLGRT